MFGLAVDHFLSFWEKYHTMLPRVSWIRICRYQDLGTKRKAFFLSLPLSFLSFLSCLTFVVSLPCSHTYETLIRHIWIGKSSTRHGCVPTSGAHRSCLVAHFKSSSCLSELCKEGSVDFTSFTVSCRTKDRSFIVKGKPVQ